MRYFLYVSMDIPTRCTGIYIAIIYKSMMDVYLIILLLDYTQFQFEMLVTEGLFIVSYW